MNFSTVLEDQVRIQTEAISTWKRWMALLVVCGVTVFLLARFNVISSNAPSVSQIVQFGGFFVTLLSVYPYREMVPRKERLATYRFLLDQFKSFERLSADDQSKLLSMATDALGETWKR
ncbi:MAG: hypothetical protein P4L26_06120 [Terracidiphilus sp.]|nr:hypothetical protein [Terracidiphilus sp.]